MTDQVQLRRAVIFSGGNLGLWALTLIRPEDYIIGADYGAAFLLAHGVIPDYSLGDFDTVTSEEKYEIMSKSKKFMAYDATDKEATDTQLSIQLAVKEGYKDILIVGVLGSRFDHCLANVSLLVWAQEKNISLLLRDETNKIQLCKKKMQVKPDGYFPYISLVPLSHQVTGITLQGFQYPLTNGKLTLGQSTGISNKLISHIGEIQIKEGLLLLIYSRD